jgi:osmotically-inducible protein OsmY
MHGKGLKRLPVVDEGGVLIGIVSRRDLLKAYARTDEDIRRDVVEGVMIRCMFLDPSIVTVGVFDGVVTLTGEVERRSEVEILARLVGGLDGVVGVRSHLSFRYDDSGKVSRIEPRI